MSRAASRAPGNSDAPGSEYRFALSTLRKSLGVAAASSIARVPKRPEPRGTITFCAIVDGPAYSVTNACLRGASATAAVISSRSLPAPYQSSLKRLGSTWW